MHVEFSHQRKFTPLDHDPILPSRLLNHNSPACCRVSSTSEQLLLRKIAYREIYKFMVREKQFYEHHRKERIMFQQKKGI